MAVNKTIEEAIIIALRADSDVSSFLGSDFKKKIFITSVRSKNLGLPAIGISVDLGPAQPRLPAMEGIVTIILEFAEKKSNGKPTTYRDMNDLREHVLDALHKIDFSTGNFVLNHFVLTGGSEPIFDLTDKVWKFPLIFETVFCDNLTIGR